MKQNSTALGKPSESKVFCHFVGQGSTLIYLFTLKSCLILKAPLSQKNLSLSQRILKLEKCMFPDYRRLRLLLNSECSA